MHFSLRLTQRLVVADDSVSCSPIICGILRAHMSGPDMVVYEAAGECY